MFFQLLVNEFVLTNLESRSNIFVSLSKVYKNKRQKNKQTRQTSQNPNTAI